MTNGLKLIGDRNGIKKVEKKQKKLVKASTKPAILGMVHGKNNNNEIFGEGVFKILTMKDITSPNTIH